MARRLKMVLVVASAWSSIAIADAEVPALALSLEESMERAALMTPAVVLARYQAEEAAATRIGADVVMPTNPRVSGEVRPGVDAQSGNVPGYAALLEGEFEVSNASGARVDESAHKFKVAKAQVELERRRARGSAFRAYVRAQGVRLRLQGLREGVELAERVRRASEERLRAGAAGETETAQVMVELGELRAEQKEEERGLAESHMELRRLLDVRADQPLELLTPLENPPPPEAMDVLLRRALGERVDIRLLRARSDLLEASDARLSREAAPKLGAHAGVDAAPASPIFLMVGLSVELPVAQHNQGPRAIVQRERITEEMRTQLTVQQIERDVVLAYALYESSQSQLRVLREEAVPYAERNLELVETGWKAGRFDVFRLIIATRDLLRTRRKQLDALLGLWEAQMRLEAAVGGLVL